MERGSLAHRTARGCVPVSAFACLLSFICCMDKRIRIRAVSAGMGHTSPTPLCWSCYHNTELSQDKVCMRLVSCPGPLCRLHFEAEVPPYIGFKLWRRSTKSLPSSTIPVIAKHNNRPLLLRTLCRLSMWE